MTSPRTPGLLLSVISLLVLGGTAFAPVLQLHFVNWDDPAYVLNNPLIRSWSPAGLAGIATETITRNYAPLTIFTLLVDHTLWGLDPFGYHLTNLLLHLTCGILVLLLIRQLTGSLMMAWTTAALFLVHPVQVETVAWIASRKGLLSGVFILSALLVRLRPDAGPRHDGWYIGMLAAALLSKALAVILPPIVLVYDMLVRREKFPDAIVRQVIPGLMSLLLLLHTMGAQNSIMGGMRGHMELNLLQILASDMLILWQYLGMLAYPADLCVLYDPPLTGIAVPAAAAAVGWCGAGAVLTRLRSRSLLWPFGGICFLLLLFPVLNFFRITSLMNDRYLYLPCVVVFAMVAAGLQSVGGRLRTVVGQSAGWRIPLVQAGLVGAALCGCVVLTRMQLPVWQNSESLWTDAMRRAPQITVVRIQLALTLHDSGRIEEALQVMQRALQECSPDELDRARMLRAISDWTAERETRPRPRLVASETAD